MRNRFHRLSAMILVAIMVFTLTGCVQLAREDGEIQIQGGDRLIGVFVSFDYIDLFDMNRYVEDNINFNSFSNGNIVVDGNTSKYNGRLYAAVLEEEVKPVEGNPYTIQNYVFEGVEGSYLISARTPEPRSMSGYTTGTASGDGFSDIMTSITAMEEEEGFEVEGTLYVTPYAMEHSIYINPVYQQEDGSIYLLSGTGHGASGDMGEGSKYSQTLTETNTIKENKESKIQRNSVKVSVETVFPIESVSIIQMDVNNQIVKEDSYDPEHIPEDLKTEDATEYIMIETVKLGFSEEKKVERTIFTKEDQMVWCLKNYGEKLIGKTYINVDWSEEE